MEMSKKNIIIGNKFDIGLINELLKKPEPFAQGEELFWNDPHISKGMLEAHLNPDIDAASRKTETIERTVKNLVGSMNLKKGDRVLDLGCGPGLYCKHFAQMGIEVTGVDYSQRSIEYGIQDASRDALNIEYKYMNYLDVEYSNEFDAVLLIYGDLCVLSNDDRDILMRKIHKSLKINGYFAFDVTTRSNREKNGLKNGWYAADCGFWKPGPHLVLENGFDYSEKNIYLDQYIVIEESGKVSIYRNWFHDYSLEEISGVLISNGFSVQDTWSDLTGEPYKNNSEWIGIIAKRK